MNEVTALFLRRIKAPLILIVAVYSIAILGMILIPGVDDNGNVWHMSIFHAFYFVSYTATTIGFGEIPYPLTEAQRLWTIVIIYMTVISWFYALGTAVSLYQNKAFQNERKKLKFKRDVKQINRPYYIVCGYGETGKSVVDALLDEHFGAVIIEQQENISELNIQDKLEYVPSLTADASEPEILAYAGVHQDKCRGVIAVTSSDETNLIIAISSKLLHPDVTVICRSENKEHENNMLSFGTDHIINPFKCFASIFGMTLHSPSMQLIYDWLTGAPNTSLSAPANITSGHWILSGYGRLGQQLHKELIKKNIRTVVIDPREETKKVFIKNKQAGDSFIIGTGTDEKTLTNAGIETAAGIIAGTNNDSNNLSIIMTARQLNKEIFVVARENSERNKLLYKKVNEHYQTDKRKDIEELSNVAHLAMQPSEIITRQIRSILLAPLLIDFISHALLKNNEWANITISRLSAVIGDNRPYTWSINITKENTPAIAQALGFGRNIQLRHILQDPTTHSKNLACVPLLLKRGETLQLLPDENIELKAFDQLLFCGLRKVKHSMSPMLTDLNLLNYVMTSKNEPQSYVWKKITRYFQRHNRRSTLRK
ncbi:Potassium channel protein [hydrothermal vent metagenome]|uniref:Potassium channel protein n=1 Tax=hydrothermal vent metagenome TaxID=652676 RepID=A0A3B0WI69_9ZZZZ